MNETTTDGIRRYSFEIEREEKARKAAAEAAEQKAAAIASAEQDRLKEKAQQQMLQRDLRRLASLIEGLPFMSIFRLTIKAIIAFWLANLLIALLAWALLVLMVGSVALPG